MPDEETFETLREFSRRTRRGRVLPWQAVGVTIANAGGGTANTYTLSTSVQVITINAVTVPFYVVGIQADLQSAADYRIQVGDAGSPMTNIYERVALRTDTATAHETYISPMPSYLTLGSPVAVQFGTNLTTATSLRVWVYYHEEV